MQKFFEAYKASALKLSHQVKVLYLAYQDPRVPLFSKLLIGVVVGYALSPIDLIPDFIPVFGLLDDLLIIPVGIYWCLKFIPKEVIQEAEINAEQIQLKKSFWSAVAVVLIWLLVIGWFILKVLSKFQE